LDMMYTKKLSSYNLFTSSLLWHFPFEFLDFGKVRGKWCFGGLN
jgi:hypothetical protein